MGYVFHLVLQGNSISKYPKMNFSILHPNIQANIQAKKIQNLFLQNTLNNFHHSSKQSSETGSGVLRSILCNRRTPFNTELK